MRVRSLCRGLICQTICVVLAVAIAAQPSAAVVAQQAENESAAPPVAEQPADVGQVADQPLQRTVGDTTLMADPAAGKMDVKYVTPQAVAYAAVRPHQFMTSPNTTLFPIEVVTAAGVQHLGIDPVDIDEMIIFVEPPTPLGVSYGAIIKFAKPFDGTTLSAKFTAHAQPGELNGKKYLQSLDPRMPSLYMPDNQTLLVMPDMTLRRVLAPPARAQSPMIKHIGELPSGSDLYFTLDIESLRPLINPWLNVAVMKEGDKFPAEAKPFLEIPNLVTAIDLTLNISHPGPTALVAHANDAASIDRLLTLRDLYVELHSQHIVKETAKLRESDDPVQRAVGQYMDRVSQVSSNFYQPLRAGNSLILLHLPEESNTPQQQLVTIAVIGVLVALLLPAVQAAREAARRSQSANNMRQIMLGILVYTDANGALPANAIYSDDGQPLLSWRVAILPKLGYEALYNQFKLDEPWDSPHNRALIAQMPDLYANPNAPEPGKTNYLAFVGPECIFNGTPNGLSLRDITDGTSKTIVFVEANPDRAVEWTKPDDLKYDANQPAAGFGSLRPGGCSVAWCDGSIRFMPAETDLGTLRALVTPAGGEVIQGF